MSDRFQWWVSARKARSLGCTHHARYCGIVPGFARAEPDHEFLWVSRSDLLSPLEDILTCFWVAIRQLRGEDPDFFFTIGKRIEEAG